jgi:hypothetical protein
MRSSYPPGTHLLYRFCLGLRANFISMFDPDTVQQDHSVEHRFFAHRTRLATEFAASDPQDQAQQLSSLLGLPFSSSPAPNAAVPAGLMRTEPMLSNSLHGTIDAQSGHFGSDFSNLAAVFSSNDLLSTPIISFQATTPSAARNLTVSSPRQAAGTHPLFTQHCS